MCTPAIRCRRTTTRWSAKLIAHGDTRDTAIARMRNALAELVVEGIKTNTALHQEILNHTAFRGGGLDIHYLERRLGLK